MCEGTVKLVFTQVLFIVPHAFWCEKNKKINIMSLNNKAYSLAFYAKTTQLSLFNSYCYLEIDDPDKVTDFQVNSTTTDASNELILRMYTRYVSHTIRVRSHR